MKTRWIVIPRWWEFQHYKDRDPVWIKAYVRLLDDEDYLALPPGTRSVLHGIWLAYASSDGRLTLDTRSLSSRLRMRVTSQQLKALVRAGFIATSASRPLALRYQVASPETEEETETDKETDKSKSKSLEAVPGFEENGNFGFDIPKDLLRDIA